MGQTLSRRSSRPPPLRPLLLLVLGASLTAYLFLPGPSPGPSIKDHFIPWSGGGSSSKSQGVNSKHEELSLDGKACRATFPGLLAEVDRAVAEGSFDVVPNDEKGVGPLQVRIVGRKIQILSAPRRSELSSDMREVSPAPAPSTYKGASLQRRRPTNMNSAKPPPSTSFTPHS